MAKLNLFTFHTELCDWETDRLYGKNRYYNPSPSSWLSRDPVGEPGFIALSLSESHDEFGVAPDGNLYAFVANNPINQIDPFGLALYAIDGTWSTPRRGANPWILYLTTSEPHSHYWRGPRFGASGLDSWGIAMTVKNQICAEFCAAKKNGDDFKINLTGWSRGAIIAAGVAKTLNDLGCDCCGTLHKPVPVNWVGLFDAVAKMPFDRWWGRSVPPNVAHFDHAVKTWYDQPLVSPTWHFTGENAREFYRTDWAYEGSPTSHSDIGMSYLLQTSDAYNWIVTQAIAAGVGF
jgi:RHS repeat-associated protein